MIIQIYIFTILPSSFSGISPGSKGVFTFQNARPRLPPGSWCSLGSIGAIGHQGSRRSLWRPRFPAKRHLFFGGEHLCAWYCTIFLCWKEILDCFFLVSSDSLIYTCILSTVGNKRCNSMWIFCIRDTNILCLVICMNLRLLGHDGTKRPSDCTFLTWD